MADDPIVTEPYDPVLHGDIQRYKCPGQNARNSMWNYTATTRCRVRTFTTPNTKPYRKNGPKFRLTYPVFIQTFTGKRKCGSVAAVAQMVLQSYKPHLHFYCLHIPPIRLMSPKGDPGKCSIRLTSSTKPVGRWSGTCRWSNKNAPENRSNKRLCRVYFTMDHLTLSHPSNRFCLKFIPQLGNGQRLCRRVDVNVREYVMRANLERCRILQSVDFDAYESTKICRKLYFTDNLPNSFGVTRYPSFNCRFTTISVQTFLGKRNCNILKSFDKNVLTYTLRTGFYCKRTSVEVRLAMRWRCGGDILGYSQNLIYGRVWGGRIFNPFMPRQSGRMIGKIK